MRTYRNSLCKFVPPLKSPTITRLPFVGQSKISPKAKHHKLSLVKLSSSAKRVVFSISSRFGPAIGKGQEASGFGSGVLKYSIGYFQVYSCQSSSIPTYMGLTESLIHDSSFIAIDAAIWSDNLQLPNTSKLKAKGSHPERKVQFF